MAAVKAQFRTIIAHDHPTRLMADDMRQTGHQGGVQSRSNAVVLLLFNALKV